MAFKNNAGPVDARYSQFNDFQAGGVQINNTSNIYIDTGRISPDSAVSVCNILSPSRLIGAAYNERMVPPKCFPTTRQDVIQEIMQWSEDVNEHPMCWLYGSAGSGKSALAHTVAENWAERGKLAGTFFFDRGVADRSDITRFIPTVAYQLVINIPSVRAFMGQALRGEPSIPTQYLQHQFQKLIVKPLLHQQTHVAHLAIVIDALDECGDQDGIKDLVKTVAIAMDDHRPPLRVFMTSRDDHRIQEIFRSPAIARLTKKLSLSSFDARADIRTFFRRNFDDMYARKGDIMRYLPKPWPSDSDLEDLVAKSCGSFLFASTVVKFVDQDSEDLPNDKLHNALKTHTGLDPLYKQVFSVAPQGPQFERIIGTIVLLRSPLGIRDCGHLLQLEPPIILLALRGLRPVLVIPDEDNKPVRLLHASLPEFLTDRDRSRELFIDSITHHTLIMLDCLRIVTITMDDESLNAALQYACQNWLCHLNNLFTTDEERNILDPRSQDLQSLMDYLNKLASQRFDAWVVILARDRQLFEIHDQLQIAIDWLRDNMPHSLSVTLKKFAPSPSISPRPPRLQIADTGTSQTQRSTLSNPSSPRVLLQTLNVLISGVRKVLSPAPNADIAVVTAPSHPPASDMIKPNTLSRFFTRLLDINNPDIIVLVMDPTNSFLQEIEAAEVPINCGLSVSAGQVRSTKFVKCTLESAGRSRNVVFVNSGEYADALHSHPDKFKTTDDVRKRITQWLDKRYPRKNKVAGILYLHPIFRRGGPFANHLKMFEQGFGDWRVMLATTRWNLVDPARGSRHEEELRTTYWQPMIQRGSDIIRLDYTVASALRAADRLLEG